jgi:RNA polymerase sigma-70 factor, ECF subfamily
MPRFTEPPETRFRNSYRAAKGDTAAKGATGGLSASEPTPDVLRNCSDEELLARFCKGNREAFAVLVHRYERELYGYLCRYLDDSSLAEDVFQNAFLQVYLKIDHYEPGRKVRPWLYTIAINQAIDALRRKGRRQTVSLDRLQEDSQTPLGADRLRQLEADVLDPSETAVLEERRLAIREVVNGLPEYLRQVVILGYYQGLKYQEIADILNIPLGTVKSRLNAALHKLHDACSDVPAFQEEHQRES